MSGHATISAALGCSLTARQLQTSPATHPGFTQPSLCGHNLPLDKQRQVKHLSVARRFEYQYDGGLRDSISAWCDAHEVEPFYLLQSLFGLLVGRLSHAQQIDLVSAAHYAQQCTPARLVKLDLSVNAPLPLWTRQLRKQWLSLNDAGKVGSHTEMVQFHYQLAKNEKTLTEPVDLALVVQAQEQCFVWHYDANLFSADTIHRFNQSWLCLLGSLVMQDADDIHHLPLMSATENARLLSAPTAVQALPGCHVWFDKQAAETPEAIYRVVPLNVVANRPATRLWLSEATKLQRF